MAKAELEEPIVTQPTLIRRPKWAVLGAVSLAAVTLAACAYNETLGRNQFLHVPPEGPARAPKQPAETN